MKRSSLRSRLRPRIGLCEEERGRESQRTWMTEPGLRITMTMVHMMLDPRNDEETSKSGWQMRRERWWWHINRCTDVSDWLKISLIPVETAAALTGTKIVFFSILYYWSRSVMMMQNCWPMTAGDTYRNTWTWMSCLLNTLWWFHDSEQRISTSTPASGKTVSASAVVDPGSNRKILLRKESSTLLLGGDLPNVDDANELVCEESGKKRVRTELVLIQQ